VAEWAAADGADSLRTGERRRWSFANDEVEGKVVFVSRRFQPDEAVAGQRRDGVRLRRRQCQDGCDFCASGAVMTKLLPHRKCPGGTASPGVGVCARKSFMRLGARRRLHGESSRVVSGEARYPFQTAGDEDKAAGRLHFFADRSASRRHCR